MDLDDFFNRVARQIDPAALMHKLEEAAERAMDRTVRIAVTGLRRSGKTVFLTALAHHLLDGSELSFLEAVHGQRYLGARLRQREDGEIPAFPFVRNRQSLRAEPPHWPPATEELAHLGLDLRFFPRGALRRRLGGIGNLRLDIIDYPGEWLLDLGLLARDYVEFSREALDSATQPVRAKLARDWLGAVRHIDPAGPADDETAARLAGLFSRYLKDCQNELGISLVQPGRFVTPGEHAGSKLLHFVPLPPFEPRRGTLGELMIHRYELYKRDIVGPFYRDHASRVDRQIVLIDLLSVLNNGRPAFDDTATALAEILRTFRYGPGGRLARLLRPRVDRLVFAATKADHVAHNQHGNLRHLLERMVSDAAHTPRLEGIDIQVLAIAALRCTDTVRTEHQGQVLSCVRGALKDGGRETVLFPGEIPPDVPEPEDWTNERFRFRDFAPRRLRAHSGGKPQHIRLDQALEALIGDRLV